MSYAKCGAPPSRPRLRRPGVPRTLSGFALILLSFCTVASAHEDTLFRWAPDGTLLDYPEFYSPAAILVEPTGGAVGAEAPAVTIRTGGNELRLPECLAALFAGQERGEVRLAGSWYHDLGNFPPYLWIGLPWQPLIAERSRRFELLFNMQSAELLRASEAIRTTEGTTTYHASDNALPRLCDEAEHRQLGLGPNRRTPVELLDLMPPPILLVAVAAWTMAATVSAALLLTGLVRRSRSSGDSAWRASPRSLAASLAVALATISPVIFTSSPFGPPLVRLGLWLGSFLVITWLGWRARGQLSAADYSMLVLAPSLWLVLSQFEWPVTVLWRTRSVLFLALPVAAAGLLHLTARWLSTALRNRSYLLALLGGAAWVVSGYSLLTAYHLAENWGP